jgi:hypothetical protein
LADTSLAKSAKQFAILRISKERKRRPGPKDAVCGWTQGRFLWNFTLETSTKFLCIAKPFTAKDSKINHRKVVLKAGLLNGP